MNGNRWIECSGEKPRRKLGCTAGGLRSVAVGAGNKVCPVLPTRKNCMKFKRFSTHVKTL